MSEETKQEPNALTTGNSAPFHPDPWKFLSESGLLFEINRAVLHPLGYALTFQQEADGTLLPFGLVDATADTDGMAFEAETFKRGWERHAKWLQEVGAGRHGARLEKYGKVLQTQPHDFD